MLSRVSVLRAASVRTKAVLPDLPYQYHELEPYISADIMELHHSKHHQTYVNNLNVANEALQEAIHAGDVTKQIQLNNGIKFNGGGHLNHTIFWQVCNFYPEIFTYTGGTVRAKPLSAKKTT